MPIFDISTYSCNWIHPAHLSLDCTTPGWTTSLAKVTRPLTLNMRLFSVSLALPLSLWYNPLWHLYSVGSCWQDASFKVLPWASILNTFVLSHISYLTSASPAAVLFVNLLLLPNPCVLVLLHSLVFPVCTSIYSHSFALISALTGSIWIRIYNEATLFCWNSRTVWPIAGNLLPERPQEEV